MIEKHERHTLILYVENPATSSWPDEFDLEHPRSCEQKLDPSGMFATYPKCGIDALIADLGLDHFVSWKSFPPGEYEIEYWFEDFPGEPDRFENGINLIFHGEIVQTSKDVRQIMLRELREGTAHRADAAEFALGGFIESAQRSDAAELGWLQL